MLLRPTQEVGRRGGMSFVHHVTVRFYEIDRAGIAFFGRFFEYAHAAFEEMQLAAFGDMERRLTEAPFLMPLVHAESDFAAPVRLGDRLSVALDVERLGETSITFRYAVTGEDGAPRATVRLVHAFIERATWKKCPGPAVFTEGLRRLGLLDTAKT
jgi:YbgC/YbaW family acyl-CoA thioester hydrolase